MHRLLALAAAATAVVSAAVPTAASADRPLVVLSSRVKFPARARDGVWRGRLDLSADYLASGRAFDPEADGVCLMLGPCGILRRGQIEGVQGRVDEWGDWTLRARRPWGKGSRVKVEFSPATGRLEVQAKGVDLSTLAATPGGVHQWQFLVGDDLYLGDAAYVPAANGRAWDALEPGIVYDGPVNESLPPPSDGSGGAGLGRTGAEGDAEASAANPAWWDIDIADPGVPRGR